MELDACTDDVRRPAGNDNPNPREWQSALEVQMETTCSRSCGSAGALTDGCGDAWTWCPAITEHADSRVTTGSGTLTARARSVSGPTQGCWCWQWSGGISPPRNDVGWRAMTGTQAWRMAGETTHTRDFSATTAPTQAPQNQARLVFDSVFPHLPFPSSPSPSSVFKVSCLDWILISE